MLKKIVSIVSVVALSVAFVGCDANAVADKAKTGDTPAVGAGAEATTQADEGVDASADAVEAVDPAATKPAE